MFSKQNSWFYRKVLCLRAEASIAWSILLLPITTALFVLLSRVSIFHPIQCISDALALLTASSSVFSLVLLSGVVVMMGILNFESHTVVPSIPCTRIAQLGKVLNPRQSFHSLVHAGLGMLVSWCAAVTIGGRYSTLVSACTQSESLDTNQMCLNEYHLLLLLSGAFMGYSHSFLGVLQNMEYVSFPVIQQYKYLRFKGALRHVVKCSAKQSLCSLRNFLLIYYFLGHVPKAWISTVLNLQEDSSLHALDTLAGLLDLPLFYHLWISGTFLLLTWHVQVLLFRIYISEAYSFPVQSSFPEETEDCLPKVLTCKDLPILKFLALQDLSSLSQHSAVRRWEVFSLSQPGGHPHNWNAISKECLSLLSELTQSLVSHHDAVASNGRSRSSSAPTPSKGGSVPPPAGSEGKALSGSNLSYIPKYTHLRYISDVPSPMLWSSPTDPKLVASPVQKPTQQPPPPAAEKPSFLSQWVQNRKEQLPEATSQALFADSQAHIWALEGLSHLVKASYTEDKFGVMQTTLPSILSTMLSLLEAVERHFKLPHASSKPARHACSMVDPTYKTLRFALRAALKTAIYRIANTFGQHLNDVHLSADHRKRMQQFLEHRE
ncbi:nucleoporin NDC1 isoform X2 [Engraulis encrasicolus]|uniref:nucleoporin NDC1 isoform X2 n=1 Tax=Engraulis encrasicolus TaxID=184585 RepID=UPI002FD05E8F